jgi:hypothetical protein
MKLMEVALRKMSQAAADAEATATALFAAQTADRDRRLIESATQIYDALARLTADQGGDGDQATPGTRPVDCATLAPENLVQPLVLSGYKPARSLVEIPRLTRIGTLRVPSAIGAHPFLARPVPALVPILGTRGLLLGGSGAQLEAANRALQSVLVRLIAALPPGKIRLTMIDCPGLGQNFTELSQFHEVIRGDMAWHDSRQIEERIDEVIAHMSLVLQKYLRNEYADLEAYNAVAEVPEAYRVVAVAGFPAGFSKKTADQLATIAKNGPRVGVYVAATMDESAPLPHGFDGTEFKRTITVLRAQSTSTFLWRPAAIDLAVTLDDVQPAFTAAVVKAVNAPAATSDRVEVGFHQFVPTETWAETTADGVSVPIGRYGARDVLRFEIGQAGGSNHHALVGGRTGSGKSILLHTLITNLALQYSPEELELYLIDFKEGVEFDAYRNLPHAKVVAVESEREFGLSVLDGLQRELNSRGETFKRNGGSSNLRDYRKTTGMVVPRILFVADEFQVFFRSTDRLASRARELLDDLARRGRSFGIHLVLSSQTISAADVEASTLAQMGLRIALQLSEGDSYRFLAKDNNAAALLERPGDAIYNAQGGALGGNRKFQVAFLPDQVRKEHISRLAELARSRKFLRTPRVFEGNRAASVDDNRDLARVASGPAPALLRAIPLYLGEPTTMDEQHTSVKIRRQSRSNLLLVGQEEQDAFAVFSSAWLSLVAQCPPGAATLYALNLTNTDDKLYEEFQWLAQAGQDVRVGERRHVAGFVTTLSQALEERSRGAEQVNAPPPSPIVLGLFGLQRARDLLRDGGNGAVVKQFSALLRDGPDMAIHCIVWADTFANVLRSLENRDIAEFDARVALLGGDSARLLGEQATAVKLKRHHGVLYQQDKPTDVEKFRCYELSSLQQLAKRLSTRGAK